MSRRRLPRPDAGSALDVLPAAVAQAIDDAPLAATADVPPAEADAPVAVEPAGPAQEPDGGVPTTPPTVAPAAPETPVAAPAAVPAQAPPPAARRSTGRTLCRVLGNVIATGVLEDGSTRGQHRVGDVAEFADSDIASLPGHFEPLG